MEGIPLRLGVRSGADIVQLSCSFLLIPRESYAQRWSVDNNVNERDE